MVFFPIWIIIVLMYWIWETSRKKLENILFQKLYWPSTVRINCSNNPKIFANSWPSKFQKFFTIKFVLTVGQNNFGNKIAFLFFFASGPSLLALLTKRSKFRPTTKILWCCWMNWDPGSSMTLRNVVSPKLCLTRI